MVLIGHSFGGFLAGYEGRRDALSGELRGPHGAVVLLHGLPGYEVNGDSAQARRRAGWNVLLFHYRGTLGAGGAFSFSSAIEDTAEAPRTGCVLTASELFAEALQPDLPFSRVGVQRAEVHRGDHRDPGKIRVPAPDRRRGSRN